MDSASAVRHPPHVAWGLWRLAALASGAAAALVIALALLAPLPLLGARVPPERLKQLVDHWLHAAACVGIFGALIALKAVRCRRRRFADSIPTPSQFWLPHLWLLLLPLPALAVIVRPTEAATIAASWSPWCLAFGFGGWLAGLWRFGVPEARPMAASRAWTAVLVPTILFGLVFAALAILQYRALHVPHGDAGMYEEHLWNLLHGKGFRSQLDDGRTFLGEHIEFVHVFLIPLYVIRQELPTLNVCQAFGLASGAIAVFGIAKKLMLPMRVAVLLSWTYLCWFPMQAIALEQTWKTFRPETLGVPLLLFGFWMLESERFVWAAILFVLSWTAKEEFAIVTGFVGVSMCLTGRWKWGLAFAAASFAYLVAALQFLIPFFRAGAPPHYTPYFKSLGSSPKEIVLFALTHPVEMIQRLFQRDSLSFLVMLLAPWMFLPLATVRRFLPALPIFGYLLLADLPALRDPRFHFHAPLVGLLPWAAAWGLSRVSGRGAAALPIARLAFLVSLLSCVWFGRGPLSYAFYEPAFGIPRVPDLASPGGPPLFKPENSYWRDLYLPTARSEAFRKALPNVKPTDRVAATDYIRNRFTHCRGAHDYPTFRAHVGIDDVDVFVLDKTEGYWGRDPKTNLDHELLDAMNRDAPVGTKLTIRRRAFSVVHHDDYFLVVRRTP